VSVPADAHVRAALEATLGPLARIERRAHAYATSFPLEELSVELADGRTLDLLLKDLRRERLAESAGRAKPAFLHDPRREIDTYRRILAPAGLGTPALYAADGTWLVLERVDGVALWQVGGIDRWCAVARALAVLHRRLAERASEPHLLRYDASWYRLWLERARASTDGLELVAAAYERAVERLLELPSTVIHGELYASNVLVAGDRICIVDWETAACGPGLVDLAALTTGWSNGERAAITAAYGVVDPAALDAARLHLAVRWLGWTRGWQPPPEQRRDWLAEAVQAAERLGGA
jgi:aminoglycoside phosphotransferase